MVKQNGSRNRMSGFHLLLLYEIQKDTALMVVSFSRNEILNVLPADICFLCVGIHLLS